MEDSMADNDKLAPLQSDYTEERALGIDSMRSLGIDSMRSMRTLSTVGSRDNLPPAVRELERSLNDISERFVKVVHEKPQEPGKALSVISSIDGTAGMRRKRGPRRLSSSEWSSASSLVSDQKNIVRLQAELEQADAQENLDYSERLILQRKDNEREQQLEKAMEEYRNQIQRQKQQNQGNEITPKKSNRRLEFTKEERDQVSSHHENIECVKTLLRLNLLGFVIFSIIDNFFTDRKIVQNSLMFMLDWTIQNQPELAILSYICVHSCALVIFVPSRPLAIGAGFVFVQMYGYNIGMFVAICAIFVAVLLGSFISFYTSQYLFRDFVKKITEKSSFAKALDICFEDKGLQIMIMLRLAPIVPCGMVNYITGMTAISFHDYFLSTFAIIPPSLFFVMMGAFAAENNAEDVELVSFELAIASVSSILGALTIMTLHIYFKDHGSSLDSSKTSTSVDSEKRFDDLVGNFSKTNTVVNSDKGYHSDLLGVNKMGKVELV